MTLAAFVEPDDKAEARKPPAQEGPVEGTIEGRCRCRFEGKEDQFVMLDANSAKSAEELTKMFQRSLNSRSRTDMQVAQAVPRAQPPPPLCWSSEWYAEREEATDQG